MLFQSELIRSCVIPNMFRHTVILLLCTLTLATSDEVPSDSTYGERLADSSSYIFNSVSARDSAKEEGSVYSSGINAILNSDGFLNSMTKIGGNDPRYTPTGPVEAAVHTKKTVEVIPVRFEEPKDGEPQVIEITPYEVPLSIVFKTQTNKIQVNQEHKTENAEEVKETSSEEEPHRVVHNVYRPVIQEVTEVIQPYRKVLQKVEPVIEEMKTIISKAAPGDGQTGGGTVHPQTSNYGAKSNSELVRIQSPEDGRFSRYGGNELGRGLSIIPIAYGSELVKKLTSPPSSSSENEISRRYGYSNRNRSGDNIEQNGKEDPSGKPTDYNDIIKDYINKFIEQKSSSTKPNHQANQINPNSIKLFNVPMKNAPTSNSNGKNQKDGEKPRFKVIKEFRVTLDDLKKLKLAPFVLPQKNSPHFGGVNSNGRNMFNGAARPSGKSHWSNFSLPVSASSFRPVVRDYHEAKSESSRSNIYNSPKRMGDAPLPKHISSSARNENTFNRRRLQPDRTNSRPVQEAKAALSGISPPNLMFGQENFRRSEPFQRSTEDQAFFESKRLRP